jgi:haloalkane dehalogenase
LSGCASAPDSKPNFDRYVAQFNTAQPNNALSISRKNGLKLKQVVLVAHDLSGQPGIDWALDNESKTSALVLLNTYYAPMPTLKAPDAIQFYSTPGLFRDIAIWGANKVGARFEVGLASQIEKFFSNSESRQIFVPILAHDSASIRLAFFSSTSVLWADVDARAKKTKRIQQFQKPTHIIFGADDPFLNKGVAASFQALFPKASLDIVEKAGHYVQLDRGDDVASIILQRLKGK